MVSPETLVRHHLKAVKAYSSARDEFDGEAEVYLDANENSIGSASAQEYNRYPDPHHKDLKSAWGKLKGLPAKNIFFGNGSDEPIDLLIRLFCEPKEDHIITMPPTYGMYSVSAGINAVENIQVPLTQDFDIDIDALSAIWTDRSKLLFICSPNNPTGNLLSQATIVQILNGFPGMVVVDEAYIDFAPSESWISKLDTYPNLIVLQTLSKAWGMAGIRVGACMANAYVIAMLERIKPPYNLSKANQTLALEALDNVSKKEHQVSALLKEKKRLEDVLPTLPGVIKVHPSDSNFLLAQFEHADQVFHTLMEQGLIVRNRSTQLHCEGCLRITIGTRAENDRLLDLLG